MSVCVCVWLAGCVCVCEYAYRASPSVCVHACMSVCLSVCVFVVRVDLQLSAQVRGITGLGSGLWVRVTVRV